MAKIEAQQLSEKEVKLIRQFRYASNAWDHYAGKALEIKQQFGRNNKQYWINREKAHEWQNQYEFYEKLLKDHNIILPKI